MHIYSHDDEKDSGKICTVEQIEEIVDHRHRYKYQKDTGTFRSSGIQEECESYPIHEALDINGKMHQPETLFLPNLHIAKHMVAIAVNTAQKSA